MTLARLVDRAKPAYGTYRAIAEAAGISESALNRALKHDQVLGTDLLLALAEAIGESPDAVLRAAGKADTADRLVRLYEKPARPLSSVDRALTALPVSKKRGLLAVAK